MSVSTRRVPQLNLRLDSPPPDAADRWHDGTTLAYLGGNLRLVLDTRHQEALRDGDVLDLPLPPEATPRQIQDRAEAWLRAEAKRYLQQIIEQKFLEGLTAPAPAERRAPRLTLSFAARGHWVELQNDDTLKCNWRLIEQAPAVIGEAIARALASAPPQERSCGLFGAGRSDISSLI